MKQKIYFQNSNGFKLGGVLSNSTNDRNQPVIILCHGFTTSKESFTTIKLEEILNKENIATFRFDFFGHGESEGGFSDITISEGVDNVLSAIKFLKSLGYSKIGLFGSSFGGTCSIMAASQTNELYLLALKSPLANYIERDLAKKSKEELEKWKETGYWDYVDSKGKKHSLKYDFFEDAYNHDGYEAATKIKIPTFIVHGDEDTAVPVEQSMKISKILPDVKLEIIEGANHNYSGEGHFDKMIKLISKFIIINS